MNKTINRILFFVAVMFTGAIAGALVWVFFFVMDIGLTYIWETLPERFEVPWLPLVICVIGGLIIGLYEKKFGPYPESLNTVLDTVKRTGRYEYDKIGVYSLAALLPLIFGGSLGPEAGLTGAIAGLCTWVGDRMKRFGAEFKYLTSIGISATLTAVFTAPLFGFAASTAGKIEDTSIREDDSFVFPKTQKAIIYLLAIAGALGAFTLLATVTGKSTGLPHFYDLHVGMTEIIWFIPLMIAGAAAGWLYHIGDGAALFLATKMGDRPVVKAVLCGFVLALCGIALPYTMFSGETQATELSSVWMTMGFSTLILTGYVKVLLTPYCIRSGWRGGHFFPAIFAGISIGYGFALISGADPVFCACACSAALVGGIMKKPLMTVLLLFLCFPLKGLAVMFIAAAFGAAIPLPKRFREPLDG